MYDKLVDLSPAPPPGSQARFLAPVRHRGGHAARSGAASGSTAAPGRGDRLLCFRLFADVYTIGKKTMTTGKRRYARERERERESESERACASRTTHKQLLLSLPHFSFCATAGTPRAVPRAHRRKSSNAWRLYARHPNFCASSRNSRERTGCAKGMMRVSQACEQSFFFTPTNQRERERARHTYPDISRTVWLWRGWRDESKQQKAPPFSGGFYCRHT